ncbi:MAG TPA: putative maltokinase, partial [Thermoanaerobaculia bacterium]|nr:putative maltokinase [Thermoanaerobaculia bacterium]
ANLPETHEELRRLRRHVDEEFHGRLLLAEANQWPEDAVAYFGDGDECQMAFHFPLMPRMFMALRSEDRFPIVDILDQTPAIPESCQWAIFLRNHDELTLEMVTDEERDYMYRVYAHEPRARINLGIRRRLAPLLGHDRRRIELLNGLLFSLPGTPVVYYGDEIGMGDNIHLGDRHGVRTPMQWSADRNAGFSRANPQRLYLPVNIDPGSHYEAVNVEAQHDNPHSLLWWMRRVIRLRRRHRAFGRGSLEIVPCENRRVLSFVRRHGEERILVVANLSRYAQHAELDLGGFAGHVPVELFGHHPFPAIGTAPYALTISPHSFYWFALEAPAAVALAAPEAGGRPAALSTPGPWRDLLAGGGRARLEELLPEFLRRQRWFGGKSRPITRVELADRIPLGNGPGEAELAIVKITYRDTDPETYLLPLTWVPEGGEPPRPEAVLAPARCGAGAGFLVEGSADPAVAHALLQVVSRRRRLKGEQGELSGLPLRALRELGGPEPEALAAAPLGAEQSNSSTRFGDRLVLKLFRRLEEGPHPDFEVGQFLAEVVRFPHVPPVAGSLEYRDAAGAVSVAGLLQGFVRNEGDAWLFTLDAVGRYFGRVLALPPERLSGGADTEPVPVLARGEVTPFALELMGTYLEQARLLGRRTAELHLALASRPELPDFAPEPFNPFYQRSLYQSMRNLSERVIGQLAGRLATLPAELQADAARLVAARSELLGRFRALLTPPLSALRTRHHGDLHLGQVLWTGRDFVLFDFEGEPARPLSTRRLKLSPLRDVAGMLRSFDYAAHQGLAALETTGEIPAEGTAAYLPWAAFWSRWAGSAYLRSYLRHATPGGFLPTEPAETDALLAVFLLEKAVYELGYELDNRPHWLHLPLRGLLELVGG